MLRRLPALLLLASFAVAGDAQPPAAGDAPPPPPPPAGEAGPGGNGNGNGRGGRDGFMQRMIAENPELKGVDLNTPEGQDKLRQVMQARMEKMAPQMRQRMAEQQAQQHTELKKTLAMKDEEFAAIEPLLTKVENLRFQKNLVDRAAGPGGPGGPGGFGGGRRGGMMGGMDPKVMLGDTPIEPTVQEISDALKALKALTDDQQANATELTAAVVRLRKGREAFQAVLTKAEEELRAVLSQRQEAVLVDRGTLE